MTTKSVRSKASRKSRAGAAGANREEASLGLADVVGAEINATWVAMLRSLVPQGRTHRLAVMVAAMLQHAVAVAISRSRRAAGAEASKAFPRAIDDLDMMSVQGEILEHLARLFRDAGVSPDRVNARGDAYSIIDSAIAEFVAWENMPWE